MSKQILKVTQYLYLFSETNKLLNFWTFWILKRKNLFQKYFFKTLYYSVLTPTLSMTTKKTEREGDYHCFRGKLKYLLSQNPIRAKHDSNTAMFLDFQRGKSE